MALGFNETKLVEILNGQSILPTLGTKVYLISLLLIIIVPFILQFIIYLATMSYGRPSKIGFWSGLIVAELIRILLVILTVAGILPYWLNSL